MVMKKALLLSALISTAVISACTPTTNPHFKVGKPYTIDGKQYVPNIAPRYAEIGIASWYGNGDGFNNELTANGELFNKDELSAAHKTLPLPSVVKVTNLENGRTIKLRVNDRGPFVKGRIIDVSELAAEKLGFRMKGSAKVLVELDKEASLEALQTVSISDAGRQKMERLYSGEQAIAGEKKIVKIPEVSLSSSVSKIEVADNIGHSSTGSANRNIKVISQALDEDNQKNMPASLRYKNSSKTDRIIIRDEIVKPVGVANSVTNNFISKSSNKYERAANNKGFFVQIASLKSEGKAAEVSSKVNKFVPSKIEEAIINGSQYYRVRVGSFDSKAQALDALENVRKGGFKDAYIVSEK